MLTNFRLIDNGNAILADGGGHSVLVCEMYARHRVNPAGLDFLVHAANCHPELVAALKTALPHLEQEAEQRETSGLGECHESIRMVATLVRGAINMAEPA